MLQRLHGRVRAGSVVRILAVDWLGRYLCGDDGFVRYLPVTVEANGRSVAFQVRKELSRLTGEYIDKQVRLYSVKAAPDVIVAAKVPSSGQLDSFSMRCSFVDGDPLKSVAKAIVDDIGSAALGRSSTYIAGAAGLVVGGFGAWARDLISFDSMNDDLRKLRKLKKQVILMCERGLERLGNADDNDIWNENANFDKVETCILKVLNMKNHVAPYNALDVEPH